MKEQLYAKRYIGRINTGASRPVIMEASDNKQYVIKFKNNRVSIKVLVNDLIGCKLASKLELPVAEATSIYIPQILIDIEPELKEDQVEEGYHFGSLYYPNTISFTGEKSLSTVNNMLDIPKIIAFDLWIGNDDRADNPGNLLIGTSKEGNNIIVIDYGNAFNNPDWIQQDLKINDIIIPPFDGEVYSVLKNKVCGEDPFHDICFSIESLSLQDINECINEVPDDWNLQACEKDLLIDFLYTRRHEVRAALNDLKNEFYFWRR